MYLADHVAGHWESKDKQRESDAQRGERVWEHVREGAEVCDEVGTVEGGSAGRHRVASASAAGVEAESDQVVRASGGPVTQTLDPSFKRKDDDHVRDDSENRNVSRNSSATGEKDLIAGWYSASVGEEAIVEEDADEACAWHDGAGGSSADHWSVTSAEAAAGAYGDWNSTTAEPTSKTGFAEEVWSWKPDYERQKKGAWDDSAAVSAATPETWISEPDYQQQKVGTWDTNSTEFPDVVNTWGCKPGQLHKVGTWDDSGTPDTTVVEEHECTVWYCICWHCTQDRRSKDSDSDQKEGLWVHRVNENEPILEKSITLAEEENAVNNEPCSSWDCDEGSNCWVHGSEQQEWSFEEGIVEDEAASVNHTIVTTNAAEQDSWGSQNDGANDWSSTADDWSPTADDWSPTANDWSSTANDWSWNMGTEQSKRASADTVKWDKLVTYDDVADRCRCTGDSWRWSNQSWGPSRNIKLSSSNLMTCACNNSSWDFESKQRKAKAWSDIDEIEPAARLPYVCKQDMDAKVDEAFMSTGKVQEDDSSYLTDNEDEKAAGDDVLIVEMERDDSDDGCLWDEVSDCDTVIHTVQDWEEGWDTVRDFEVSTEFDLDW